MNRFWQFFLVVSFIVWMTAWFWVFSFAFSSSFFKYHLETRLPSLFLALFSVAVAPLSAYRAISRTIGKSSTALKAYRAHLVISGVPIFLFWAVHALWVAAARILGSHAFEADEAMGVGIDFYLCLTVFLAVDLIVACVLLAWRTTRKTG